MIDLVIDENKYLVNSNQPVPQKTKKDIDDGKRGQKQIHGSCFNIIKLFHIN